MVDFSELSKVEKSGTHRIKGFSRLYCRVRFSLLDNTRSYNFHVRYRSEGKSSVIKIGKYYTLDNVAEIIAKYEEIMGKRGRGGVGDSIVNLHTVDDVFEAYVEHSKYELAESTMKVYICAYKKHIQPTFGRMRCVDMLPIVLMKWQDKCNPDNTVKKVMKNILGFDEYGYKTRFVHDSLGAKIKLTKAQVKDRHAMSRGEVMGWWEKTGKANIENSGVFAIFIALNTGMRRMNCLQLKWGDVDLEKKIARVKLKTDAKSVKSEVILSDVLCEQLRERRLKRDLYPKDSNYRRCEYVCNNEKSLGHIKNVEATFEKLMLEQDRIKGRERGVITMHSLRRFVATEAFNISRSEMLSGEILHHVVSTAMTSLYITNKISLAREVLNELTGELFGEVRVSS